MFPAKLQLASYCPLTMVPGCMRNHTIANSSTTALNHYNINGNNFLVYC